MNSFHPVVSIPAGQKYDLKKTREESDSLVRFVEEPIAATTAWLYQDNEQFAGNLLICDLSKVLTVSVCHVDSSQYISTIYSQTYPSAGSDVFDLECVRIAYYDKTSETQWSKLQKTAMLKAFSDRRQDAIDQINKGLLNYAQYPDLLQDKTAVVFGDEYILSCGSLNIAFNAIGDEVEQALTTAKDWCDANGITIDRILLTGEFSQLLLCEQVIERWVDENSKDLDRYPQAIEQGVSIIASGKMNPHPSYSKAIGIQLSTLDINFDKVFIDIPLIHSGEWLHDLKKPTVFTESIATSGNGLIVHLWVEEDGDRAMLPVQTMGDRVIPVEIRVGAKIDNNGVAFLVVEDSKTSKQQSFGIKGL